MNSVICFGMWDDTKIKDMKYFDGFVQIATNLITTQLHATDWDKVAFLENLLNKAFWTLFELNNCIDQKLLFENHIKVPQNQLNQGQWDFVYWPLKGNTRFFTVFLLSGKISTVHQIAELLRALWNSKVIVKHPLNPYSKIAIIYVSLCSD